MGGAQLTVMMRYFGWRLPTAGKTDVNELNGATGNPLPWWQKGERPDYRFSLANERTFLAWIRTSLALIAGGVGIEQFASHLGFQEMREALALCLLFAGAVLSFVAYRHWVATESAMRANADIPHTGLFLAIAAFVTALAAVLALMSIRLAS